MRHRLPSLLIAAVLIFATSTAARAQSGQVWDPEDPPETVTETATPPRAPGKNSLSLTLSYVLPGFEYSRRVASRLELTVGFNSLWVPAVPLMPSVGAKFYLRDGDIAPFVYGKASTMFFPGLTSHELYGGGAGVEWRRASGTVLFAQAGAFAARWYDTEEHTRGDGFSVVPDVLIGVGRRF